MAAVHLGDANCPLCGCFGARVSLSKNGLAVLTCNSSKCRGMQMFARSPGSDEMIRDRISAERVVHDEITEVTEARSAPKEGREPLQGIEVTTSSPPAVDKTQASGMGLLKNWF